MVLSFLQCDKLNNVLQSVSQHNSTPTRVVEYIIEDFENRFVISHENLKNLKIIVIEKCMKTKDPYSFLYSRLSQ